MILECEKKYMMRNGVATKILEITDAGLYISDLRWVYENSPGTNYVYSPDRLSPHDIVGEA